MKQLLCWTFTLTSLCLCAVTSVAAQEWTRFRGPNGSGLSDAKTIPTKWEKQNENWRVELPGIGHSSPVLWGDRLFLSSGDPENGTRLVFCRSTTNGKQLWLKEYAAIKTSLHKLNSFANSTPVVDSRRLYHCWTSSNELFVAALDHQGSEIWRRSLGPFKAGYGFGISPIIHNGMVVIPNDQRGDSSLIAIDAVDGSTRWRVDRETKTTYSTPCVYQAGSRPAELIFTNWKHGITAIDPATGKTNWEADVFDKNHLETAISSPFVSNDLIYGTCGYLGYGMQTVAVRPDKDDAKKGEELFRIDRGAPLTTTPVVANGLLFLWSDKGIVTCVDASTGELHWKKRVGGNYYGSPVVINNFIYSMSAEGECVVLDASKEYRLIARNSLGEGSHASPAVANGTMYLRTFSQLISIGGNGN